MARRKQYNFPRVAGGGSAAGAPRKRLLAGRILSFVSFVATAGLVLVLTIAPTQAQNSFANSRTGDDLAGDNLQTLAVTGVASAAVPRDNFTVTIQKKAADLVSAGGAPAVGRPDPGSAQAIAHDMVLARGWGEEQFACLVALFNRESHWNVYAANPSGAYGIPQALPGAKMASAGADWATNPTTQISWGLNYIAARYNNPCGAWNHSQEIGWY